MKAVTLKKLLHYDPETGIFTWLVTPNYKIKIGDVAGCVHSYGYIRITINNKRYLAHRLAFLYMSRNIPKEVDHINGNTSDNRWYNLRACSRSQNQGNQKLHKNNISGYKGVCFHKITNQWMAQISFKSKRIYLGLFSCKHRAAEVYNKAALEYFGEFAKLNKIRL